MPWTLCAEPEGVDLVADEGPDSCVKCDQPTHFPDTNGLCEECAETYVAPLCVEDLPAGPDTNACERCGQRVGPKERAAWGRDENGTFRVSHWACEEKQSNQEREGR